MSSSEHSKPETQRSVYDTCDPVYLRQLRETAGIDLMVLARTACLSVAQVRQLESHDGDNLFYSDAIKRQAYKRLLMILGAEPPTAGATHELHDAKKVVDAHLNTLDQIVAMNHRLAMNHNVFDLLNSGVSKLKHHKQVIAALLLLGAVVLFAIHVPQRSGELEAVSSAASEVVTARAEPLVVAEATQVEASVSSAASSEPMPVGSVASADVASKVFACAYSTDAMPQVTPFITQKEGRYVYLTSTTNTEVCVVDGNKQVTMLQMKAGENRSVYGVSPWQVSSPSLSKLQVFFQGGRVTVPDAATHIQLLEVPVTR